MVYGTKEEILSHVGGALKACRLQQNISQQVLAERSGVSLNAVKNLETGSGATLGTFILVCRTLGKDGWIDALTRTNEELSPIAYLEALRKATKRIRERASKRTH